MKVKAVFERVVEGKYALLLLNPDEREYMLPLEMVPEGAEVGSWLEVLLSDGEIQELEFLAEETEQIQQRIEDKLSKLRKRGSSLQRKSK